MEQCIFTYPGCCSGGPPSHLLALNLLPQGQPSTLPVRKFVVESRSLKEAASCINIQPSRHAVLGCDCPKAIRILMDAKTSEQLSGEGKADGQAAPSPALGQVDKKADSQWDVWVPYWSPTYPARWVDACTHCFTSLSKQQGAPAKLREVG